MTNVNPTILAVDDSASMRQMLAYTLRRAGYDVVEACDGREALSQARERVYDLVITDQNMPNMDGLALTAALRTLPGWAQRPILVLTTESGPDVKAAGRAAGATGWLQKPFDPERLVDVIARLVPSRGATS